MEALQRENILKMVSPKRLPHVLGVETAAAALAEHWGVEVELARSSALLHDCTKKWTVEEHLQFCQQYTIILDKYVQDTPKLLHSITGAAMAKQQFGAPDCVVDAVRYHTMGRIDMSVLEKIIFLADKSDVTRDYDGVEKMRKLSYENLDKAMLFALDTGIRTLLKKGRVIHPDTLNNRNYYLKIVSNG